MSLLLAYADWIASWASGSVDISFLVLAFELLNYCDENGTCGNKILIGIFFALIVWWGWDKLLPLIRICDEESYEEMMSEPWGTDESGNCKSCEKVILHPKTARVVNWLFSHVGLTVLLWLGYDADEDSALEETLSGKPIKSVKLVAAVIETFVFFNDFA
mmetsp:Transcript_21421/g.27239  ORF Transcript_21421/g.27239 Transcript_21421/m.27239 type:complete len:160 (-) Transcript_21421:120-599(-)